jgi:hypothetical protein
MPGERTSVYLALAAPAGAVTVAACGGTAGNATLPACSTGRGGGESATLAIRQDGDRFTGTYLAAIGGGASLRYDVRGTASGGHFTSSWSVGSVELPVTGTYTADSITLDNPGGKFSITRFTRAAGCPS